MADWQRQCGCCALSWLTEFSCPDHAPPERQLAFMKEILPAFDAMPDVIPRYAWFVARGAENTNDVLITNDGLNALGRYYNDSS
ncbi:glycoside hydrolase family protein [bacterium]|nr:glycoside hydrolase family protein [bacterium]